MSVLDSKFGRVGLGQCAEGILIVQVATHITALPNKVHSKADSTNYSCMQWLGTNDSSGNVRT